MGGSRYTLHARASNAGAALIERSSLGVQELYDDLGTTETMTTSGIPSCSRLDKTQPAGTYRR